MSLNTLEEIAAYIVSEGKGILAVVSIQIKITIPLLMKEWSKPFTETSAEETLWTVANKFLLVF